MLLKDARYYKQAKVYCSIDMFYPEDKGINDEVTYFVTLHIQECNNMDLAIYDEEDRGDYFDLSGNNLETKMEMA